MRTDHIIAAARESEEFEQLVPLLNDKDLQTLLAAWPKLPHKKIELPESSESWESLWSELDYTEFGEMIGMRPARFEKTLTKAIAFKLIYPGGEIHEKARAYLRGMIAKAIGQRKKSNSSADT